MKQICLFLILCLILTGCAGGVSESPVLVFIEEIDGCTVENNGQRIAPGEDAVFTLHFDYGIALAGTDYDGTVHTETDRRTVTLTLVNVTRPTRVKLSLTHNYAGITYHACGGTALHSVEDHITRSYSLSTHIRPNTETGADLFRREGYTLVSWNTDPDGSGTRVGLGSRVSVPKGSIDLYAQWADWSPASDFTYVVGEGATVIGYSGSADTIVIPETLGGAEVTAISSGAFQNCTAATLILPTTMDFVEDGAFQNCSLEEVILFDSIVSISDASFVGCDQLRTLRINAIEAPYGYLYRKESCYADKVDLLIQAQGQRKLVFYSGCSIWYNLDGAAVNQALGSEYRIINMGLNGTANSVVQMQILGQFLDEGDILFHAPELSSRQQMLTNVDMLDTDTVLWCGIENNYDLFAMVDLQTLGGVFDSLCAYLDKKDGQATYAQIYTGDEEQAYMDSTGSVPFYRGTTQSHLEDKVYLDPARIREEDMARLEQYYDWYQNRGVTVYISYACINMDAVPEDQRNNVEAVEEAFSAAIEAMDGPVLISRLSDFLYENDDFYDTNYHLLTQAARENTQIWLRDLLDQMEADGLWKEGGA